MSLLPIPCPPAEPPKAIWWFKVYCWALCTIYALLIVGLLLFFLTGPRWADFHPKTEDWIAAGGLTVICLGCLALCAVPLFVQPRPWVWVYSLVIICFGLTSGCVMFASIPLLIFWVKPDVKAYYGSTVGLKAPAV
jgi:hypothetical protein